MSVVAVNFGVLTAIAELFKVPRRTSQKRPDVCTFPAAIVFSVIMMESGSLLRRLANSVSTIRNDCLVVWSSECFVSPYGVVFGKVKARTTQDSYVRGPRALRIGQLPRVLGY